MAYTYQDFYDAANAAGLLGQFSQYDLDLAQRYPEAGLTLVSLKKDYANATTDEQRILINEAANQVRNSYGSYTGGRDGSQYYATGKPKAQTSAVDAQIGDTLDRIGSYGSFNYGSQGAHDQARDAVVNAPSFSFDYGNDDIYQQALRGATSAPAFSFDYGNKGMYQEALDAVTKAPSFSYEGQAPVYENAYAQQQKELLDAVLNHGDFSWSKETDPLWGEYKKSYLREGDRATANALGQASAASGGRASSYAVNAASQAGDYYASQLNDIIPTLYQQAYNRYLQDYQRKASDLGMVNSQEQQEYQKYLNDLGQFNTDRNFALSRYNTEQAARMNALNAAMSDRSQEWSEQLGAYNADRNARMDALNAALSDRGQAWTEQLGAYNADTQARLNALDALSADRAQSYDEWLNGYNMLQSYLGNLQGQSDTIYSRAMDEENQRIAEQRYADQLAQQELENQIAKAKLGLTVGDTTGLEGLGITPDNEALLAYTLAAGGRTSPIGTGSTGNGGAEGTGGNGGAGGSGGSIDSALAAQLKQLYPDGNVTSADDWNYLLSLYDEETLNAAGYRYGEDGETGDGETSGSGTEEPMQYVAGVKHENGTKMTEGFREWWPKFRDAFDGGASRQQIAQALLNLVQQRVIEEYEADIILDQLGINAAGTGGKHGNGGR